ncbi:undecaprenyldiphospho-muramoylpentapeptide beta-N-acetylglucosaminyltransferase [Thermodesulfobacteriota bacterium]
MAIDGRDEKNWHDEIKMIIAGGGTGGHLFPGLAIGKEIAERYERSEIVFITGLRKIEAEIIERSGFKQESINIEGLKGRGWKGGLRALTRIPLGLYNSVRIIKRMSPNIVLGVGGYSSGPACLAAKLLGVPTAVHEQNSYPGLTNRLLCRFVDRVFISFEESRKYFSGGSIYLTGNPVRRELIESVRDHVSSEGSFTILVMGGSQGARAINKAFIASLEILTRRGKEPLVIHQTGERDIKDVLNDYKLKGLKGEVYPFIQDMAATYQKADIVVNRAGATTISELAALGKPSILIPYPYATNRHQDTNAQILAGSGGAVVLAQDGLTGESLADILMKYMDDRKALLRMGKQARKVGRPEAVRVIADEIENMAFRTEN